MLTLILAAVMGFSVVMGFAAGVLFCEFMRAPEPECRPKRRRLQMNLVVRTDGRAFIVRSRPRAWRRLRNKIEDESCEGR